MPPSNSSTEDSYRNNTVFIYSELGKMHDEFQLDIGYDCLIWKESGQNETIHKASSETQRKRFVESKVIMSSSHFVADK